MEGGGGGGSNFLNVVSYKQENYNSLAHGLCFEIQEYLKRLLIYI